MTAQDLINILQALPAPTNTTVQIRYTGGALAVDTEADADAVDQTGALTVTPTGFDPLAVDGGVVIIEADQA